MTRRRFLRSIDPEERLAEGTYRQGYVTTTYDALVASFGEPNEGASEKTTVGWVLLLAGVVVTIHDWKQAVLPIGTYDWSIGGSSNDSREVDLVKSVMGVKL